MMSVFRVKCFLAFATASLAALPPLLAAGGPIEFNKDVRPILSENCFACHGPDEAHRKAKMRLDQKESVFAERDGHHVVVAGKPDDSEIIHRITNPDPDDHMPPPKTGKTLTPEQIATIRRWIQEGAPWQNHWAFVPPRRSALPMVEDTAWPRNSIDFFTLARMEKEGLKPSPEAARATLLRRVTLDLTGLPPTPAEMDAFLADKSPQAYEQVVDRLLNSPHYGEQMARYWLDAARYGDTHGLHLDNERSIWPYRDWVIRAFNENMPFDEFTIEQLGGDLLPHPTQQQLVATGFNRCNVTTSEGGAIPEEFKVRYCVDRTSTMATVWMGLTAGCAVCHDHKFDPITQKEFYQLYAFFNRVDEDPMDGNALLPPPVVKLSTPEQERDLAEFDRKIEQVRRVIRAGLATIEYSDPYKEQDLKNLPAKEYVWIDDELPMGAKASGGDNAWKFVSSEHDPVYSGNKSVVRTAEKEGQQFFTDAPTPLIIGKGDRLFAYAFVDPDHPPKTLMLQFNQDGSWDHRAVWGEDQIDWGKKDTAERRHVGDLPAAGQWVRLEVDPAEVGLEPGSEVNGWAFTQFGGTVHWDKAGLVSQTPQGTDGFASQLAWEHWQRQLKKSKLPQALQNVLKEEPAQRTSEQAQLVRDYFLENVNPDTRVLFAPLHDRMAELQKQRQALDNSIPRSLVMHDKSDPPPTHVLKRGEYDKPGVEVTAGVPAILPPFPANAPTNRLGLAEWLVDPQHPLTARVTVNRFWQHHFGIGIVKTAEDFGSQGDVPSHPQLLDWLATEFMRSGWDMKHINRLIVTSATYRQSSHVTPDRLAHDPDNRLLARGPRYRLDAEVIRDDALAISGLLTDAIGGHGVKPYQPEGLWKAIAYPTSNTSKFVQDHGAALYRRSLYTFWKRTSPPPALTTFDAPSRESCRVRRERTNTPLQALVLMNDRQYVEAARHLAARMVREGGADLPRQLDYGFRLATGRHLDPADQKVLVQVYQENLQSYRDRPEEAGKLLAVGESAEDVGLDACEMASLTMVANLILNLDETITLD